MMLVHALAIVSALLAQEKTTLKFQPRQGDAITLEGLMNMSLKGKMGEEEFDAVFRNVKKATTTYVEVIDTKIVKKTVVVTEETDEQNMNGKVEKKEKPLHGRTITVTFKDGKPAFEGGEKLDDDTLQKVAAENRLYGMLPKDPVAIGDSWTLKDSELKSVMESKEDVTGSMTLTFKEVREVEGHRCAVLTLKWDVSGPTDGGADMAIKLEGEMIVEIARGYALSIKGKGTVTMSAGGEELGTGPITLEMSQKLKEK